MVQILVPELASNYNQGTRVGRKFGTSVRLIVYWFVSYSTRIENPEKVSYPPGLLQAPISITLIELFGEIDFNPVYDQFYAEIERQHPSPPRCEIPISTERERERARVREMEGERQKEGEGGSDGGRAYGER